MSIVSRFNNWFIDKLMNAIKKRREEEERENQRKREAHNKIGDSIDIAVEFKKKLDSGYYEDYIEYSGEMMPYDVFEYYDHGEQKVSAETLMYSRIRAKYGDVRFEVDKIDVPWPIDTIGALIDMSELNYQHRIKNRRLYWKVNVANEGK